MHLRLSDQELATLIEMVSLAADVAVWNRKEGAQGGIADFEALEAKLMDKAGQAGLGDLLEYDSERQRQRFRQDLKQTLFFQECYDEFRNESFWEELVIRLADRDLVRAVGQQRWEAMSEEERRASTRDIEKRYWDEFTRRGIERVMLVNPPGEG